MPQSNPLHILSLGAGVQSSTLALMAAHGEIDPMPFAAIFADTQDEPSEDRIYDPRTRQWIEGGVYGWLDWLEAKLPFPVHRCTKGKLSEAALKQHISAKGISYYKISIPFFTLNGDGKKGKIPHRKCTSDFKIKVILRKTRDLVGKKALTNWRKAHASELAEWREYEAIQRAKRKAEREKVAYDGPEMAFPFRSWEKMQADALVVQWIGISIDETQRMKPSRDPWIACRWPLVENRISRSACLEWMRAQGYPEPPRSACVFCPFRSDREWRHMQRDAPSDFARAVEFDRQAREIRKTYARFKSTPFVHRSCKPLDDVDFRNDTDRGQLLLWQDECSGICGV